MKSLPKFRATAVAATLAVLSLAAQADLARRGPVDPAHGFPTWYQDLSGLALDLCLPSGADALGLQAAQCLLETPGPYVFPDTFPEEAFYFRATSVIDLPTGGRFTMVLAHEAAFANGAPQAGQQVVFTRVRVVGDAPEAGHYTITHPYGTIPADVAAGGPRTVNSTEDVGLAAGFFDQSLTSRVGPYLKAADAAGNALPPVTINGQQFLADVAAPVAVTGSPFGTNTFMVCGTRPDGSAIVLGTAGPSGTCVENPLFTLTGKVHDLVAAPIGSPLVINAATYSRDATGTHVNVHATAGKALPTTPIGLLSAASDTLPPVRLVGPDPLDRFFSQGFTDPSGALPGQITVTNSADAPPSTAVAAARDIVTIASSAYDEAAQTLTVVATSSDKGFGAELAPALGLPDFATVTATAGGIPGDTASMTLVATGVAVPPTTVRVESAAGGAAEVALNTSPAQSSAAGSPFTGADAAVATAGGAPVVIPVLANDRANAAAPIDPASIAIVAPGVTPALGTVVANPDGTVTFTPGTTIGVATFRYTVTSAAVVGASNPGLVTVNIGAPVGGALPIATGDTVNMLANQTRVVNVLANDNGNGGTLDAASVQVVAGSVTGGTATSNVDGTITFASGASTGTFGFDYTVANTDGNVSAPAHVTVVIGSENVVFNLRAPECRTGINRWRAEGSGAVPNTQIAWYATSALPADPTAATPIQVTSVLADGTFAFDAFGPTCQTRSSFLTNSGTRLEGVATRQR